MTPTDPETRKATNIRARDEAREIARGVGIVFDTLQEMVDDIERKLVREERPEKPSETP